MSPKWTPGREPRRQPLPKLPPRAARPAPVPPPDDQEAPVAPAPDPEPVEAPAAPQSEPAAPGPVDVTMEPLPEATPWGSDTTVVRGPDGRPLDGGAL